MTPFSLFRNGETPPGFMANPARSSLILRETDPSLSCLIGSHLAPEPPLIKTPAPHTIVSLIAAVGCGLLGGYILGRSTIDRTDTSSNPSTPTALINGEKSLAEAETAIDSNEAAAATIPVASTDRIQEQFAQLLEIDSSATRAYSLQQLFESMSLDEAPTILSSILAVENSRDRMQLLRPFFERWGRLDGQGAFAKAQELVGRDKNSAIYAAMTGWAKHDPFAAWEVARESIPGASPTTANQFRSVIVELGKRDLNAALAAFSLADNRFSRSSLRYAVLEAAFDTDQVHSLVTQVHEMENSQEQEEWISGIFRRWGETDTGAPLESLVQISNQEVAKKAMEGFLQGWMQSDPTGAIDYAIANHEDPLVTEAVAPLMGSAFFQGTREEQLDLAARIAEAGLLDKAAPRMISTLGATNPELALHMASLVSDKDARESYTQNAIANWAYGDFEAATAYFNQLPTSDSKTKIVTSLAWTAMRREGGGAKIAAWMEEIPSGKERTKVVESLLAGAASPYSTPKPDFIAALKEIATNETELSEDALKHRAKLFGDPTAP